MCGANFQIIELIPSKWPEPEVQVVVAQGLLRGDYAEGDTIIVSADDDGLLLRAEGAGAITGLTKPHDPVAAALQIDPDEADDEAGLRD